MLGCRCRPYYPTQPPLIPSTTRSSGRPFAAPDHPPAGRPPPGWARGKELAALGACRECHQFHLGSTCCHAGLLRRGTRIRRRAEGADHISALPDDMLLQVLVRLGCARAAVHTSLLSRRWRDLWAILPELPFHNIRPEPLHAALAKDNLGNVARSFEQEISRIPLRNISGLVLELATKGHVYGVMLLDLIGLYSSIQTLRVN